MSKKTQKVITQELILAAYAVITATNLVFSMEKTAGLPSPKLRSALTEALGRRTPPSSPRAVQHFSAAALIRASAVARHPLEGADCITMPIAFTGTLEQLQIILKQFPNIIITVNPRHSGFFLNGPRLDVIKATKYLENQRG